MLPGLNVKIPLLETIQRRISIQNRSADSGASMPSPATRPMCTFKAMILYAVLNAAEETIKNVAFKFIDEKNFMQALIRTVEGHGALFRCHEETSGDPLASRMKSWPR
jgi:hypothetical protein